MKRLKITTYKSYAYMFRTDNLASLPCISSVDSVKLFLSRAVHISGYVWESTFLYNRITSNPKYYMVLFVPHLSFFLLCFR